MQITGQSIFHVVNDLRAKQGIVRLAPDAALVRAAQAKADDMVRLGYFSHRTKGGKSVYDFVLAERIMPTVVGENLARGFDDTDAVLKAWQKSPKHYANITYSQFTRTGIAIAQGPDGQYIVQLFSN